ncbi:MAG: hypothetical protein JNK92_02820 [Dechloromonas sp.]|nr:hypothetical protein [Dechloromonas sp.]
MTESQQSKGESYRWWISKNSRGTCVYTKVYSVAEGFEGDTVKGGAKDGQRAVNGWKDANLPLTYEFDKARMYFPQ